jgi:guanine deaminase
MRGFATSFSISPNTDNRSFINVSIYDTGQSPTFGRRAFRLSWLDRCGALEKEMSKHICRCDQKHGVNRRGAISALTGAALGGTVLPASRAFARAMQTAARPEDEGFMRMALAEAAKGDLPFGAVIVRNRIVVSTGRNLGATTNDPTAHGEMVAIRHFVTIRPSAELQGATLYTSGEPCPMCMSAIVWCGISRVVFAASIAELATKLGQIRISSRSVAEAAPFVNIDITGGVLSTEALALFQRN